MNQAGLKLAYGIFLAISWMTTALGLKAFLPWPVAFLLSLAISLAMGALAPALVPGWGSLGKKWLLQAGGYAFLTGVSILFATTFYFQRFSGAGLENERLMQAQNVLVGQLARQREYFSTLAQRMERLAQYSRRQAQIENTRGGTCAGSAGKGRGPFWAKRMWQADLFTRMSRDFSSLSRRLDHEVSDLLALVNDPKRSGVAKQVAIKQRIPQVAAYAERADLRRMLRDLDAQAVYETRGFPRDARYCYEGQCFGGKPGCGDGRLVERIRDVRELGDPRPIDVKFEIYDAGNLQQNIQVVMDIWRGLLGGERKVKLAGERAFSLGMGLFVDTMILVIGLSIGRNRRATPGRRLDYPTFVFLAERFDDLLHHYADLLPMERLPDTPPATDESRLHRIQFVLDAVSRPAGADKVILLPLGGKSVLRSHRKGAVESQAERRLELVIEVMNLLSSVRMVGIPLDRLRNRYRHFRGYDTHAVAQWYGLAATSVPWFAVYTIAAPLMTEVTQLVVEREPELPWHLRLQRAWLHLVRPSWFRHESRFASGDPATLAPGLLAECLMDRVIRFHPGIEREGPMADVILYPQLSVQDQVLERVLIDDDYGLHQDLRELRQPRRSRWRRLFMPYKLYRLGPKSYRALQALIDTDGKGRISNGNEAEEPT